MNNKIKLITEPKVCLIAATQLLPKGIDKMAKWTAERRPECGIDESSDLWPHDRFGLTDAELLVELAGRKCYDSFAKKAGRKSNKEYVANTQKGDFPHASIMYHPTLTFYIEGVSRRLSHEFIRHYVGAGMSDQGSPSQESTRYTRHTGEIITPPRYLNDPNRLTLFEFAMEAAFSQYLTMITHEEEEYAVQHGEKPTGMARKRIYEAAAGLLPMQAATSFVWSCNPVSLAKMISERTDESADLEFRRLAELMRDIAVRYAPNLFREGL